MTQTVETTETQETKPLAKYLQQRAARKRYSFGKVWTAAVVAGKVTDKDKLLAHAVKLKAGRKYDLAKLKFETLLTRVQAKLAAPEAPEVEVEVEA